MIPDSYFDMRNLAPAENRRQGCPVAGCTVPPTSAPSQWGEMRYCPYHRIRIHERTQTFVYYNGADATAKRDAALRNILFERDYFNDHILRHPAKAEKGRFCHETSEDALTWNVFSRLASTRSLAMLLSAFTDVSLKKEPELYLWGLSVRLGDSSKPALFPQLKCARKAFEEDVRRFKTEPDIMLYVPGQLLVLMEAKFTSGNTVASDNMYDDRPGEKPRSRKGIIERYTPGKLPHGTLLAPPSSGAFYSQLYRNLVFAIYMANELKVRWGLVNLVCEGRFRQRQGEVEFQDPTQFIHALLPPESRSYFRFYNWERLYADHVAGAVELNDLAE